MLSTTPVEHRYRPVWRDILLGAQGDPWQKALRISTPSRASWSRLGVCTSGFPPAPRQSGRNSSVVIHSTFFFLAFFIDFSVGTVGS